MNIIDSDTSYLLKLDNIDLNYITNLSYQYEGASCPIWSVNSAINRGNDEFFEFKVMAGKKNDSATESVTSGHGDEAIGYPVYMCAICDRNIPILYKKEHNTSVKHKTCVEIAETALKRVQNHIILHEDTDEIDKNNTRTYFCEACTVAVKNTDKIEHEASSAHQKSVLHDRYLKDLLHVYLDKDYLDTVDIKNLKTSQSIKGGEENGSLLYYFNDNSVKPNFMVKPNNVIEQCSSIDDKNNTDGKGKDKTNDDQTDSTKKNSVIELNDLNNEQINLEDNKDNAVNVLDKQNDSFSVNLESIAELNYLLNDHDKIIPQTQAIQEHNSSTDDLNQLIDDQKDSITEKEHSDNDLSGKTDEEQIQSNIDEKQVQSDDLTAQNDETENANNSVVEYIMLVHSKDFNVEVKTKNKTKNSNVLSESDLETYLDVISKLSNDGWPNHKLKFINKDYIKILTLDNSKITVRADRFNGFCFEDGQLQCKICMVIVDEHPAEHIFDIDHISNVWLTLEDIHCFLHINDSTAHCVHCNETFSDCELHKSSETHLTELKEAMRRSFPTKPIKPKKLARPYCEPCNIYVDGKKLNSHLNSKSHKKKVFLCMTSQMKTGESIPGTSKETTTENYISTETNNASKNNYVEETPTTSSSTSEIDNYLIKIEEQVKVICKICNKKLANADNFICHLKGQVHKRNFNTLLDVNLLKLANDKRFCEICEVKVKTSKELEHIGSKTHKAALAQFSAGKTFCEKCKIYVLTAKRSSHLSGEYHICHAEKDIEVVKNEVSATFNLTEINTDDQVRITRLTYAICKICKRKIGNAFHPKISAMITAHLAGRLHIINYNAMLYANKIKMAKDKLFCEACEMTVEPFKELEHVEFKAHKCALAKYTADPKQILSLIEEHEAAFYRVGRDLMRNSLQHKYKMANKEYANDTVLCRICNVTIPVVNSKKHLESPEHKLTYTKTLNEHRVKKVNDKYFCHICSVDVQDREEIKHIRSLTHLFEWNLSNSNKLGVCCAVCRLPKSRCAE